MDEAKIRDWLYDYINEHCIYRVGPGEASLPGKIVGKKYTWQFYLRRGLTNAGFLRRVGELFWSRFADLHRARPFQVTGLETGATPLITGIALTAPFPINAFITRAERKAYGLKNRFEGIVDHTLPVMIVDDLASSKSTMHRCKTYLEQAGLDVFPTAFAVINKDVGAHDYGLLVPDVVTLFNASDFPLKYGAYVERMGRPPLRWSEDKPKPKAPRMLDYVYGHDKIISDFVAALIPHAHRGFENCKTIGVVDGQWDGERSLIAGMVYHNWDPEAAIIEMSGAALPGKYWLTAKTLKQIYEYPFLQLGCQMVVMRVPADDVRLLGILAAFNYTLITIPRLFGRDRDGVVCTLTREAWEENRFNKRRQREAKMQEAA